MTVANYYKEALHGSHLVYYNNGQLRQHIWYENGRMQEVLAYYDEAVTHWIPVNCVMAMAMSMSIP